MQKRKRDTSEARYYGQAILRSIDIEKQAFTVTINLLGMFVALLLIGAMMFYAAQKRDFFWNDGGERYLLEDAVVLQEDGRAEVSKEFASVYWQVKSVRFGLLNATQHAGEEVTITFGNGRGMHQTGQYVIPGEAEEEICGMFLKGIAGKGSKCCVSVSGNSSVIEDIIDVNVDYRDYKADVLLLFFLSIVFLFLNLAVCLESEERWIRNFQKGYEVIRFLAMAFLMVGTMECLSGSISSLEKRELIVNTVICICLYLVAFMLTNRLRFSVLFINCFLFIVAVANHFVILFRNSPLIPYNLLSFRTAMAVVGQYEIKINEEVVLSVLMFLAVLSSACRMSFKIEKIRIRVAAAAGGAALIVGMTAFFYGILYPYWDLSYYVWEPIQTYREYGYLMSTMVFAKYATLQRPEGYSARKAQQILDSFENMETECTSLQPVNLIVVMNESWSMLDYVKAVKTNIPYNTFYQNLSENAIKGNLYVSICGGDTAQTEYEFFTGNSVSMLPTPGAIAYEFFLKKNAGSICDTLKDEDYRCLALHPFYPFSFQRDKAYEIFGFEEFITQDAFEGYEQIRSYYSDKATYEKVIELYENKQQGENLFIWDLTMQNHGGYGEAEDFEREVYLIEYPELSQASTYLTLMKYTDEALEGLIKYFEKEDEPTMIVMFGDHQPALGDETYDILYGQNENEVEEEEREKRYITPFLIWSNYGLQEDNIEQISANYLSSYVFQKAGFSLTSYQKQLLDLYQYYPVINAQGVYDAQGTYWSWDNVKNSPNYEKLHNYQIVQYYMMKK